MFAKRSISRIFSVLFIIVFMLAVAPLQVAHAATFTVTKTADTNDGVCDADCSLREAIVAANAAAGDDTITVPAGTYTLTIVGTGEDASATGDLDITSNLTINGAGAATTIVNGGGIDRVFHVTSAFTVAISGVTIKNGNVAGAGGGMYINSGSILALTTLTDTIISGNTASNGGGISMPNSGMLTMTNSSVSSNTTTGVGGGIQNYNGTVTLISSTVNSNTASSPGGGGGIYNYAGSDGGTVNLINSTISGNVSTASNGGGIINYFSGGTINLRNSTVVNNNGGGIANSSISEVNFRNTIIAGNTGSDCSGTLTSQGYNLLQNTSGCTISGTLTGNLTGVSPNLGPLQDNGGSTVTHALLAGSPAIDAGNPDVTGSGGDACEATDQRGIIRPQGAKCDIGAFEVENTPPVITSNGGGATASMSVAENSTAVTTVTATDVDAGATLTYSISGGADSAKFTISASSGVLAFASAPDFESPTDVGGNNVYDVTVQVSDGSLTDSQAIAVTVTDVGYTTTRVSVASDGTQGNDGFSSFFYPPPIHLR